MRSIFLRLLSLLALGLMLLNFSSCSKGPSSEKATHLTVKDPVITPTEPTQPEVEEFSEIIKTGNYKVQFSPLNQNYAGEIQAEAFFSVNEKDFTAEVIVDRSPINTIHGQYVHTGEKCPTLSDDRNADGVIDFHEASQVAQQIIIPLDGDIHSQLLDSYLFPVSDFNGQYAYAQSAPVQVMAEDLRHPDENIEDSIVKLGPQGKLNLENKVVMIYGVAEETELPASVSVFGSFSAQASVPIACGKIIKANRAFK